MASPLSKPLTNKVLYKRLSFLNFVLPVLLTFLVSSLFCVIDGSNPFEVYRRIFATAFFTKAGWMNTLGYATPLIMTGIATSFSIKAGVFNMGIEGQVYVGSFFAAVAGYALPLPKYLHIPVCLLCGALGGMLWSAIPAVLKSKFQINEIVTTIMLNNVALTVTNVLTMGPFNANYIYSSTPTLRDTALMSRFVSQYKVTTALIVAVILLAVVWYILRRTKFGYEIQFLGRQQEFSDAVGMRVSRKIMLVFVLGGAIAGIAGATEIMSVYKSFMPSWGGAMGIGWDGFSVCVLAAGNPLGVLIVSLLYGGFRYGCISLQANIGTPIELNDIVKCAIILFFSVKYIRPDMDLLRFFRRKRVKAEK